MRFHETGEADVLKIENLPAVEPGKGEVRLKVEAIGLNRAEVMFRRGQYLETPEPPSRLGYEAAGVVDAVGPGVTDIRIGDRVSTIPSFAQSRYGVYGESAVVPAFAVAAYPDHLGKGLTVRGYTLFEVVRDPEMLAAGKRFVFDGLTNGNLKPIIDRTFALGDIVEAHRYMESNRQKGKIVVTV